MLNAPKNDFLERLTAISSMLAESFFQNSQFAQWAKNSDLKIKIITFSNALGVLISDLEGDKDKQQKKLEVLLFVALNSAQLTNGDSLKNFFSQPENVDLKKLYQENLNILETIYNAYATAHPSADKLLISVREDVLAQETINKLPVLSLKRNAKKNEKEESVKNEKEESVETKRLTSNHKKI